MARDKAKDDKLFNCSEPHEIKYVAGLYGSNSAKVETFLKEKCASNVIYHSTHLQVYNLINKELGLPLP